MHLVHHILRYFKTYLGLELLYTVNYVESKNNRWFTSGFCTSYGNHLLSWKSKKQAIVSHSSDEAKYRAMAQGTCELLWLRSLLSELGFPEKDSSDLLCDNKFAIMLAFDSILQERIKHIEVDIHFYYEKKLEELLLQTLFPPRLRLQMCSQNSLVLLF